MIVNLIGVPIFFGSDIKGVDSGPNKLREKNLSSIIEKYENKVYDLGNIHVKELKEFEKYASHKKLKYLDEIVRVNTSLAHQVYCSLTAGCFPLVIGGDHSLGLGSLAGTSKYFENLAVIWLDAHGDINTHETTLTGNVHGMPLAAAMGLGYDSLINLYYEGIKIKRENVFIIGARDLDAEEIKIAQNLNLNLYTTEHIKKYGIENTLNTVINKLYEKQIKNIHLSFDIDILDKSLVPGTGTPVTNGFSIDEVKSILKSIIHTGLVKSMDIVELNTELDKDNSTLNTVLELIDFSFSEINKCMCFSFS